MRVNNTNSFVPWQSALIHAQALARLPEAGVNLSKMARLPLDVPLGITAFLRRLNLENPV